MNLNFKIKTNEDKPKMNAPKRCIECKSETQFFTFQQLHCKRYNLRYKLQFKIRVSLKVVSYLPFNHRKRMSDALIGALRYELKIMPGVHYTLRSHPQYDKYSKNTVQKSKSKTY